MAHTGEVGTRGFRCALSVMRVLVVAGIVLVCAGVGLLLALPVAITGLIAGIAVAALLVSGKPLFEEVTVKCPSCSKDIVTIKDFGSYQCSNCRQGLRINGSKANAIDG
ncbi:hypothetical protein [Desulfolucanica intricata]|uniref:hypothetical protein n=1 Tax=Desulfolucanica intricata TaxID=1285191 RepID=UPI00082C9431|nr:hypothetical protein [Desulfolucanica intricata]